MTTAQETHQSEPKQGDGDFQTPPLNLHAHSGQRAGQRARHASMLEWEKLASEAGLQLPHWGTAFTTGAMERWLHRLGISTRDYLEWDGSRKLGDFARRNPDWLYREWAGLILEHRALMGGAP